MAKQKKQNSFKPQLKNGKDFFETASAFQKSVRRGIVEDSLHFAQVLFFSNYHNYVWKRLATIVFEDIGFGTINLSVDVQGLYANYVQLMADKTPRSKKIAWLMTSKAIIISCKADKTRVVDNAKIWAMKSGAPQKLTHDPNGKEDDGLLESFSRSCSSQNMRLSLLYAHRFCMKYGAARMINKMVEIAAIHHSTETIKLVSSIVALYDGLMKVKKEYWLPLTFLTMILCSNEFDDDESKELSRKAMTDQFETDIPDYALDVHTSRGKRMKRGYMFFQEHGSIINNEVKFDGQDFFDDFSKKYFSDLDAGTVTERGYQSDDEPQATLFG